MHKPTRPPKELRQHLQLGSQNLYHEVLASFVQTTLVGEERDKWLGWIRAKRYDLLLDEADVLVAQLYATAEQHFSAHQLAALVRKYPFDHVSDSAELAAWKKFTTAERRCRHINHFFKLQKKGKESFSYEKHSMRNWISYVIGIKPVWQDILGLCDFGPGASIGVTGNATNFARKLSSKTLSVSPLAQVYAISALRGNPLIVEYLLHKDGCTYPLPKEDLNVDVNDIENLLKEQGLVNVSYNKITFVPKTTKVLRSIAVEPSLNGFVQKGIDQMLRRKLKHVGLDLGDQLVNQKLAYTGSLRHDTDDPYCTIDLSSASDTISTEVVRDLLPVDWFDLLNQTRSRNFMYKDKIYPYHKFSSMGNGFTFPLQTLIFSAICHAAYTFAGLKPDFRVYGDDIVVRRSVFEHVSELLRHFGFTLNRSKTFSTGPFRESCGKDYFGGIDVRPIFLDYKLDSLQSIFKFHNAIRTMPFHKGTVLDISASLRAKIPSEFRYMRPRKGQPDTAFEVELDVFMTSRHGKWNPDLQAWSWFELLFKPVYDTSVVEGSSGNLLLLMAALRGSSSSGPYALRRKTSESVRMVSHDGDGLRDVAMV